MIRLAAPPVDGAANDALVAFLAEWLAVPRRAVHIVAGERSRRKRLAVDGVTADARSRAAGSCDASGGYSVPDKVSMWKVNGQGYVKPGASSMMRV